jgi:hypothetical protein
MMILMMMLIPKVLQFPWIDHQEAFALTCLPPCRKPKRRIAAIFNFEVDASREQLVPKLDVIEIPCVLLFGGK